jgi:aspartyl protease family protein
VGLDDPDRVARLFYLALLLVWVAGFLVVGRRRNWSRSLRDLAIWGLIFLMVIIAYGFRDVLRRELMPGSAVTEGDAIAFRRAADGHFRAATEINGVSLRLIVDTGASQIVLTREDAARVGIAPDALRFDGRARTANGTVAIAPVRLDSVRLGPFSARDVRAAVNGGELDESLLGMDYLDRFSRIEISGDRLLLVP